MFNKDKICLVIEKNITYQKIHSFGASSAWWAQEVGVWEEFKVDEICDLLFCKDKGIGLNLIRYNLGGGSVNSKITSTLRKTTCIEVMPGTFDYSKDSGAINIVNKAVQRGSEVVVFTNSPPERLTVTGSTTGAGKVCNLKLNSDDEFAKYIIGAVKYLKDQLKWPISEVSPINEPQWDWADKNNQEGCHFTPEESVKVLLALNKEIEAQGEVLSISAVDSAEYKFRANKKYIDKIMENKKLSSAVNHYAVHSYWSSDRDRKKLKKYLRLL